MLHVLKILLEAHVSLKVVTILEHHRTAYHAAVLVQVMIRLFVRQILVQLLMDLHAQHADAQLQPHPRLLHHAVIQPIVSQVDVLLTGPTLLLLAQEHAALPPHAVTQLTVSLMDVEVTTGAILLLAQEHAALAHAVTQQAASVMDVEVTTGLRLTLAQEHAAQVAAVAVAVDQVLILISIFLMLRIYKTIRTKH